MNLMVTESPTKLYITNKSSTVVIAGPSEKTIVTIMAVGPAGPPGQAADPTTDYTLYYKLAKG